MASIDDLLASFGLQPGVQIPESTDSLPVSSDSGADLSEILAYAFGSITLTISGGIGYLIWRYRHLIQAFRMFRSVLHPSVNVNNLSSETECDLETGCVGMQVNIDRPLGLEESEVRRNSASIPVPLGRIDEISLD